MAAAGPPCGARAWRTWVAVGASLAASAALAAAVVGKWDELEAGITGAPLSVVAVAVVLQVAALVSRSEAWHTCIGASGGSVGRRCLYRASSVGCVGSLLHGQLATAARIAALRRSAPRDSPRVPALIAAELPIVLVEALLAALTSFTLVGPLGLPWWLPLVLLVVICGLFAGLRNSAFARWRSLGSGLAVLGSARGRVALVAFVLVAVFAQIARNWLILHAVGVDASLFDAIAVLIAVVTLSQLPFGLGVGAAASVLILGPHGMAAAAAAGVLLTATGTVGGLVFAVWAALDVACDRRARGAAARLVSGLGAPAAPAHRAWSRLATLPLQRQRSIEHAYFGGLSHLQITRVLGLAPNG